MSFDIVEIIRGKHLVAHFQPIVSLSGQNVIGLEGLIRGFNYATGDIIPPLALFDAAESRGLLVKLDRACREVIMQSYRLLKQRRPDTVLFLNINSSVLDKTVGSNHLMNTVRHCGLKPDDIVIEINESKVKDRKILQRFVDTYRGYGFLIALDDVGSAFSNLDRIPLVKPDIVKADVALVRNICTDFYVREVFRAVVNLAGKIGALVVAEGVETEEETILTLELGADMLQGYYVLKPQPMPDGLPAELDAKIKAIIETSRRQQVKKLVARFRRYNTLYEIITGAVRCLEPVPDGDFGPALAAAVGASPEIECAYVLDENGVQASATVLAAGLPAVKRHRFFTPAAPGTDHSARSYYRYLKDTNAQRYLAEPAASLASGSLCTTFANAFQNAAGREFILCIDFTAAQREAG